MKAKEAKKTSEKQVTSFEDACVKLGLPTDESILPDMSAFPEKHRVALTASAKLIIIAEALNDGWEPNWDNDNEYKYFPWFYMDSPGFRFYAADFVWAGTFSFGGSRLCFRTRKLAEYAGQTFLELYRDMMVIPKK